MTLPTFLKTKDLAPLDLRAEIQRILIGLVKDHLQPDVSHLAIDISYISKTLIFLEAVGDEDVFSYRVYLKPETAFGSLAMTLTSYFNTEA